MMQPQALWGRLMSASFWSSKGAQKLKVIRGLREWLLTKLLPFLYENGILGTAWYMVYMGCPDAACAFRPERNHGQDGHAACQ